MNFDFKTNMKEINFAKYQEKIKLLEQKLETDEMTGWYNIDKINTKEQIDNIVKISKEIRKKSDALIVIGIGGSFLGAKMVISALSKYFEKNDTEVLFAGTTLSTDYLTELIEYIEDKDICINLISKSGTTLEPNLAFDILLEVMKRKYQNYQERIYITTDENSNLHKLATENNYKTLFIDKNIGGRYSVLTPVGLLPIAVSGFDIKKLLKGAKEVDKSKSYEYAIVRHEMYKDKKMIESFTFYEEKLLDLGEWLKQLFAESHGKEQKGILPISTLNTRDLHSLGQYIQQGERIIFETVIYSETKKTINTKYKKTMNDINKIAIKSVAKAHFEDEVYTNMINLEKIDEYNIGYLIYFFELASAIGGYLLDINPFDQPGVSKYKNIINEYLKEY